ncbi:MAG TPA: YncE family protein [Thermoplasmata archaeon]|nr:YncE family protein [Thermoplasmata archaeon]
MLTFGPGRPAVPIWLAIVALALLLPSNGWVPGEGSFHVGSLSLVSPHRTTVNVPYSAADLSGPTTSPSNATGTVAGSPVVPRSGPVPEGGRTVPPMAPHAPNVSSVHVGMTPIAATVDTANGWVYVINGGSNNLSIINGSRVIASPSLGSSPAQATFDPGNGWVYVANSASNNVSVLNRTKLVGSPGAGYGPYAIGYDPANGYVYVVDDNVNAVSILNGTSLVRTVTVGMSPDGLAFDSATGRVYVSNYNSNTVSVLNGTQLIRTVNVSGEPETPIFDPSNGEVYVPDYGANSVSILNNTTVLTTVPVGSGPYSGVYDARSGDVYIANAVGGTVSVLHDRLVIATIPVGSGPELPSYNDGNGYVYVANDASNNVSVIDGTSVLYSVPAGSYPWATAYDPANGYIYVVNFGSNNVSFFPTWHRIIFNESGLPSGTVWSVNVTGEPIASSNTSELIVRAGDGVYNFTVTSSDPTFAARSGTVSVNGTDVTSPLTFVPVTYNVNFAETGLPTSTAWSVTLGGVSLGPTVASIHFLERNGTYPFRVAGIAGWTTTNFTGSIDVHGASVSRLVAWTEVVYAVDFAEVGLPTGVGWWVNLTGGPLLAGATSDLGLQIANGTYSYSIAVQDPRFIAPGGQFAVVGGPANVPVRFSDVTFAVTFVETGLPIGGAWSVNLTGGAVAHSVGANISFALTNGSYTYTLASSNSSYTPLGNAFGTSNVAGVSLLEAVAFVPVTYPVIFEEKGLPTGAGWSVTLDGKPASGSGSIRFPGLSNGTYGYSVAPVAGFTSTPREGAFLINGSAVTVTVNFRANAVRAPGSSDVLGLPATEGFGLLILAAVAGAGVAIWIGQSLWRGKAPRGASSRRSSRRPPDEPT